MSFRANDFGTADVDNVDGGSIHGGTGHGHAGDVAAAAEQFWTKSGVRLRRRISRPGDLNWLFLPGGPGIGSESLHELVDAIDVPGSCWMVDLPGDGSNTEAPGAPANPYAAWPQVLIEAALAVPNPVFVGHSTGGMYLLSTPALEDTLTGIVLVSTAPNANWLPTYVAMTQQQSLPAVASASATYEQEPSDENLAALAVASAPWNFADHTVKIGAELLARMPYNGPAVAWSDANFDHGYAATWWPRRLPMMIVSGADDRIVTQNLWADPRFHGDNVVQRVISGGQHFAWIENPEAVRLAFSEFAGSL